MLIDLFTTPFFCFHPSRVQRTTCKNEFAIWKSYVSSFFPNENIDQSNGFLQKFVKHGIQGWKFLGKCFKNSKFLGDRAHGTSDNWSKLLHSSTKHLSIFFATALTMKGALFIKGYNHPFESWHGVSSMHEPKDCFLF